MITLIIILVFMLTGLLLKSILDYINFLHYIENGSYDTEVFAPHF